jgi:septum formation protein
MTIGNLNFMGGLSLLLEWERENDNRDRCFPLRKGGKLSVAEIQGDFVFMPELILASSSPRRRELLAQAGLPFRVVEPHPLAECGICSRETPPELVARLAYQKAADVIAKIDRGLVIACDTVAECLGQILGKPEDREHARQMLQRLRGRDHAVYSGLCLWDKATARRSVRVDVSRLWMAPISDRQLEAYLDSELWVGKSGAFGFQDGPEWIELREGSASNVVGLPMEQLEVMLEEFAWSPPPPVPQV